MGRNPLRIVKREQQILRVQAASFHTPLHEALEQQLRAEVLTTVQTLLEAALVEEVLAVRRTLPVPPRRSGYYTRMLDTRYGRIPALRVPKLRTGNKT
jgi:transposase-like protein